MKEKEEKEETEGKGKAFGEVLRAKAPFILGGFLVGLLALELLLQLAGAGIGMRDKEVVFAAEDADDEDHYTILTIGDSFTFAGDVELEDTYPYRLGQLLHENQGMDVEIINLGLCEINSWQASERLEEYIDSYNPDMVLALTGATDKFNLFGTHISSAIRENTPIHDFFSTFKLYKLSNFLSIATKHLLSVLFFQSKQEEELAKHENGFTNAYSSLRFGEAMDNEGEYLLSLKFHMDAYEKLYLETGDQDFNGLRDDFGFSSFEVFEKIYFGAMITYWKRNRFSEALAFSLKVLEDFPFYFSELVGSREDDPKGADNLFAGFYFLSRAFEYQDHHSAQEVIEVFDRIFTKHPDLKKSSAYQAYYARFKHEDAFGQKIDDTRRENLAAMVALCKARNVQLVLLDYPSDYHRTNRTIEAVAKDNDLLLVKNNPHFKQLIEAGDRSQYLLDDDHCTVLGYKEMGEHVHRTLVGAQAFTNPATATR